MATRSRPRAIWREGSGRELVRQVHDSELEGLHDLAEPHNAVADHRDIGEGLVLEAFGTVPVLRVAQFLAVIVDLGEAVDVGLKVRHQLPQRDVPTLAWSRCCQCDRIS